MQSVAVDRSGVADEIRALAYSPDINKINRRSRRLKMLNEADRFETCGNQQIISRCPSENRFYGVPCSCNSRSCQQCCKRYGHKIKRRMRAIVAEMFEQGTPPNCRFKNGRRNKYSLKLVTLTIDTKRYGGSKPTYRDIMRARNEMRQLMIRLFNKWKSVKSRNGGYYPGKEYQGCGGISVLEIGAGGNLHFHCVIWSPYIDQALVSREWLSVTGDSWVVDIKAVKDDVTGNLVQDVNGQKFRALHYVLKYLTKPAPYSSAADYAHFAVASKGIRRFASYGVAYGVEYENDRPKFACPTCGGGLMYDRVDHDCSNSISYQKLMKTDIEARESIFFWLDCVRISKLHTEGD